jgi:hypothetical protein
MELVFGSLRRLAIAVQPFSVIAREFVNALIAEANVGREVALDVAAKVDPLHQSFLVQLKDITYG